MRRGRLLFAVCASLLPLHAQPYLNPDLPPETRAADLVSRMTLAEKALQMQNAAPAIPRLNVPAYDWWNEGLHGVARAGLATVFPQAIGLAAAWDANLMNRVADAISTEARAKYNEAQRTGDTSRYHGLTFWSPNINILRDPRWGRGQETYGEDPYLTSRMAGAFIAGMQGADPRYFKTIATAKHFAVHSGPDPLRHSFDAHPSADDLNRTYLPAFRASTIDAGAGSVMCAVSAIDGVPDCANSLLNGTLRGAWGFTGYVVSDCGAVTDMVAGHNYMPTIMQASAAALLAGTDLVCGAEYASLPDAVAAGLVPESALDQAAVRLFTARMRLGMFDPPERVAYSRIPYSENDSDAHRQLALEAARESIVLLKNANGILPLDPAIRHIAVVGPAADEPDPLLANYNGIPSKIVTPLDGIRRRFGAAADVRYALGSTYTTVSPALVSADVFPGGLLAEYFDNPNLSGDPKASRTEPRLYFNYDMRDPAIVSRIPRDRFSARWTGSLAAPYTGDYSIGVTRTDCEDCTGTDSAMVFLDEQPLTGHVSLTRGQTYRVRVEYRNNGGGVGIELTWIPPADALLQEARDAIGAADVAIVFAGLNSRLEGEEMPLDIPGFLGGDRTDIDLPLPQQQLLNAAYDSGKPAIVVLMNGGAIAAPGLQERSAALLEAWYGGEEAGNAIAQTLAGDNNPAGRLPVTFYKSIDQLPPFENYDMTGRTYRYFQGEPLYPFGFGLSYSTFQYSDLQIDGTQISARVTNTSAVDGDEVAQLYVMGETRELAGFERIHLRAGESRTVQFTAPVAANALVSIGGGQPLFGTPYVALERRRAGLFVFP
jgi:beta-glucosidase